jgi:hypothetical protein
MKLHELKEFTLYYILEHDNLTKEEKLQLGEFVKEANEDQVNYLLASGKMVESNLLDESMEKFLKYVEHIKAKDILITNAADVKRYLRKLADRHAHELEVAKGNVAVTAVGVTLLVGMGAFLSYKIYKRFLSKAARACKKLGSKEKTSCIVKYRINGYREQIKGLTAAKGLCNKTKKPKKCTSKIDLKIRKIKAKLGEL